MKLERNREMYKPVLPLVEGPVYTIYISIGVKSGGVG